MRRSFVYSTLALALCLGYSSELFASSHSESPYGRDRGCASSSSSTPTAPVQVKRADYKVQPAAK